MEYISERDYDYIINKYHDTKKPFDPFSRFIRHDEIYSSDTGMNGDEIKVKILENDKKYSELPHPVRKARAFEFVLKNTRISCDTRDIYPAINAIDRPLNATVIDKWKNEVFNDIIPEVEKIRSGLERDGIATMWPDYDHSVPVWDRLFALGFAGILRESEATRAEVAKTEEQDAFFEGIKITYEAIIGFVGRLAKQAYADGNEKMASALENVRYNAPASFYEALLFDYIYFMLCEHIEGLQVRSLSNLDRCLYPFFNADLKRGVSEEELRRELAYFFLQFTAIGNYWNQPFYLGGCNEDESTVVNELSYLILDVYDRMGIYSPKIQIKVADSTPKSFVLKALDMIRHGHNSIVFVGDKAMREALIKDGCTHDEARTCDVRGCYEYAPIGGIECGMNYVNLMKPLEYALHEGCDGVTGVFAGRACPPVESYEGFDDFFAEYKAQLLHIINTVIETNNSCEDYLAYINPQSMLSATNPTCLKKGRDALAGGSVSNSTCLEGGFIADAADSLVIIKKYVFEKKELTLAELRDILDNNYEGHERLRLKFYSDPDKYGNNRSLPDTIAVDIVRFINKNVLGRANAKKRGGHWHVNMHVARQSYDQGAKTAASPNGRLLGCELSKNVSASMGQNRDGATAAVLSATKFPIDGYMGYPLDMGLLPSAVKGEDGLEAMYGLLMTFVNRKGHALHINVFDADTLRDAQKNPEKYRDLQIRVCGWNVLWNNINKVEQDGFIKQAESLI